LGGTRSARAAPRTALPLNEMKQQFSLAFVQMVASAAGCFIKLHSADYDGVDITIASSAEYERWYGPQIELQVKCTAQADLLTDDTMRWKLKGEPFRLLTNPKSYLPRFLGVLLVPGDPSDWLSQDETQLLTDSCMYWQRASELGAIRDGQQTKVVHLPRSNILNVVQLQGIMKTIGDGGGW
jgi:Domain of unknown function (DUF4365)